MPAFFTLVQAAISKRESSNMSKRSAASDTSVVIKSMDYGWIPMAVIFLAVALLVWQYRPLLHCDRSVGTCTVNANDMPGNPQQVFEIASVKRAFVQNWHRDTGVRSRVRLETADSSVDIGAAWSDDPNEAAAMSDRINAFLASGGPRTLKLVPHRGMHYASLAFTGAAVVFVLLFVLTAQRFRSVFDSSRDHYRIESRHGLRKKLTEGKLSSITGTLEKAAGGGSKRSTQLGVLDTACQFHPLLPPDTPGGRKIRRVRSRICRQLTLDEARNLSSWDLKPKLGEVARSVGRTAAQTDELKALQVELESDPFNIELLRQIAIRFKRLGRSDEASQLLRARHGALVEQNQRDEANLLGGIVWTMGL